MEHDEEPSGIPGVPGSAVCSREDCGHALDQHEMYGCRAPYSGPGPSIPGAVCTCEFFDDSGYIDRAARLDEMRRHGALAEWYRKALEDIKALGCVRLLEGDGPKDCSDVPYTCATCIAAAALEKKP